MRCREAAAAHWWGISVDQSTSQFDDFLAHVKNGKWWIAFRAPRWVEETTTEFDAIDLVEQMGPGPLPHIERNQILMLDEIHASEVGASLWRAGTSLRNCLEIAASERSIAQDRMVSEEELQQERQQWKQQQRRERRARRRVRRRAAESIVAFSKPVTTTTDWRSWADMSEDCAGWCW